MFWNIVIGLASYALQLVLTPKPQDAKPASLSDFDIPTAEEGKEIGVLFGTKLIRTPNCVWYGDLRTSAIKGARRYGFFGPRQVIGHNYYLGMHLVLCHGPADKIIKVVLNEDTIAWEGVTTGGRISVEGKVSDNSGTTSGSVDIEMGKPDQLQNDYLVDAIGDGIPAFRGVVGAVLRQVNMGESPYIPNWAFEVQRIYLKSDGTEQWYPEKAGIGGAELDPNINILIIGADLTTSSWAMDVYAGHYINLTPTGDLLSCWSYEDFTDPIWGIVPVRVSQGCCLDDTGNVYVVAQGGTTIDVYDLDTGAFKTTITAINNGGNQAVTTITDGGLIHVFSIGNSLGYARGSGSSFITVGFVDTFNWIANSESFCASPSKVYVASNGFLSASKKLVNVHDYNSGSIGAATTVDLSADLFADIVSISWLEDIEKVLVLDQDGGIHIYNETLTERENFKHDDIIWQLSSGSQFRSRRIKSGSNTITFRAQGVSATNLVVTYSVPDLNIVHSYNATTEGFVGGSNSSYHSSGYDYENNYLIVHGSSGIAPPVAWSGPRFSAIDMNPAHIIRECLTDPLWGMGYNESDIDDDFFTAAADTFYAERFGLTLFWENEEQISEFVQVVQSHVDAFVYTSRETGKFRIKPIRNDYDIDTIPVVDEDDVITWDEVQKRQPAEVVNSIIVKFFDRSKSKDASRAVHNTAQIQQTGELVSATRQYPGIQQHELAVRVGTRDVKSLSAGMASGLITTKRTTESFNPGDPFRMVSTRQGFAGEVMRAVELQFGDGRRNSIGLKFTQDVYNLGEDVLVDENGVDWENPVNPPEAMVFRLVQEMPWYELVQMAGLTDATALLTTDPDGGILHIAGASPTPDAINANIYVDDGSGYIDSNEDLEFAPAMLLFADIDAEATEIIVTDDVDLDLLTVGTLGAINDEVIRVDAIDVNTLTISRGFLDTVPQEHLADSEIIWFDDFSLSDMEPRTATDVVDVKLRTVTGLGELSLAGTPSDSVTFASRAIRPYRPANVQIEGQGYGVVDATGLADVEVTWSERNRITEITPLAWGAATVTPEAGQTTIIEVLDPTGTTIITTHSGLTGTSFSIPLASFDGNSSGYVRVGSERDGYREWQPYTLEVLVGSVELLTLDADELFLDDDVLIIGD